MEDMLDPASGGISLFQQALYQHRVNNSRRLRGSGVSLKSGLDKINGDDSQNNYLEYL
ncbi:TPA: hypothetical protein ACSRV8_000127 [Enterobacter hormaechei subsp. steigerwaltii]|jgi:hypothetical protein|uniref:hypothetical protein n=1 Tax=Enterobacter hormaechei TaxID=158836 RepID=UPI0012B5979C|nr:hypothetical protein [Enterobacter hormaechei]EKV5412609.1 hypothetical protein [Enterobacter hormaechei]EKW9690266.1 hypothetical protein [Enterobacter hormaechei]EKY3888898.1 hypothetical protein [Enterobacter hormaechei]EKY4147813.1 hypothetical protein [Enterobacter hormaechei subsp. steigerwaltii]MBK4235804.1 hypothetical protein [Enterobacter hormaechei]